PLIIQDKLFNPDGSLLYPTEDNGGDPDTRVPPVWIPEFFGDTVLVNGKVWPFLEVEPRKYRFRLLNASNARFYHLTLNEARSDGTPTGRSGPRLHADRHRRRLPAGARPAERSHDRCGRALRRHHRLQRGRREIVRAQQRREGAVPRR